MKDSIVVRALSMLICFNQLLEELLDYGVPYVTEPSILKGMVPPPSLITSIVNAVSLSG